MRLDTSSTTIKIVVIQSKFSLKFLRFTRERRWRYILDESAPT